MMNSPVKEKKTNDELLHPEDYDNPYNDLSERKLRKKNRFSTLKNYIPKNNLQKNLKKNLNLNRFNLDKPEFYFDEAEIENLDAMMQIFPKYDADESKDVNKSLDDLIRKLKDIRVDSSDFLFQEMEPPKPQLIKQKSLQVRENLHVKHSSFIADTELNYRSKSRTLSADDALGRKPNLKTASRIISSGAKQLEERFFKSFASRKDKSKNKKKPIEERESSEKSLPSDLREVRYKNIVRTFSPERGFEYKLIARPRKASMMKFTKLRPMNFAQKLRLSNRRKLEQRQRAPSADKQQHQAEINYHSDVEPIDMELDPADFESLMISKEDWNELLPTMHLELSED
eukprot:augustus_masked-scaffold_5-processed-gene-19.49-mRNA-1 protein AED:1.00 eAED:1.00 QI:0/-1/0/0/-1/1/1/0/342